MVAVVLWVAILIRKHGLLACILENFANITTPYGSSYRRMTEHSMKVLDLFLPEFSWRIDTLALSDYMRPQSRVRVFIRGLRRSVAESVPPCLPPFGKCALRNVLVLGWPTHPRDRLTKQQQQNLLDYEETIRNLYHVGKALPDDIFVVPLDRAKGKVFRQNYRINQVPTLTCHNRYFFLTKLRTRARNSSGSCWKPRDLHCRASHLKQLETFHQSGSLSRRRATLTLRR